ncbi:MAG: hypothetical protein WCO89_00200 [Syntrophus sp. (in: bacteria)]
MDNCILPYKQIILDSGLLVVYERDLDQSEGIGPIRVIRINEEVLIRIDLKHLVKLNKQYFDCILATQRIILAVSEKTDDSGAMVGVININELSMARIAGQIEVHLATANDENHSYSNCGTADHPTDHLRKASGERNIEPEK